MHEQLLTVEEIAVTLAGFTALIGFLGRARRDEDRQAAAFMLRLMLEASLFVAALALFPLLPLNLGVSYAELTAAGYAGLQPPCDTFWGARYAIVEDPDGNHVGLMSPLDPARRSRPPAV